MPRSRSTMAGSRASGAVIRHGEHDRAFYRPATDNIHLPAKAQFPTGDAYYATALHELGHWTGHPSRLDRDLIHPRQAATDEVPVRDRAIRVDRDRRPRVAGQDERVRT